MKWYDVKKYKPTEAECLLKLQNKHNPEIYGHVTGYYNLTHGKWLFHSMDAWEENYHLSPTHFFIIPPIEIQNLCQHQNDGMIYTSNPPQNKCVKCGEFYR